MLLSQKLKRVPESKIWDVIHSTTMRKFAPKDVIFDVEHRCYKFYFADCSWARYYGWGWTFCTSKDHLVHLGSPVCENPNCALKTAPSKP
jgi:hypothetical protein